ncbi:MAC/Perforin domain-containing protein [Alkalibaculum bacchi]|uniref:MAC/Perforin domain-containing protein n=1 Tax=Alkalibaculum bacchi TaxID=645887 RepID=A0A366I0U4_9FIRM|nr:MAC/perforin domain-containing protein [Alkalibaculum bacchi]RBP59093.1 MAC/Perforin domain-containing protein [Alkalibaculum bacchi]
MKKCLYRTISLSLAIVFLCFNFSACTRAGTSTSENSGVLSTTFSDNEIELGEVPINNLNEEDDSVLQGLNKNYNLYGYDVLNSSYINAREVKSKAILDEAKYDASKYKEISDDLKGSDIDDYYVEKMSNIYSQINASSDVSYKNAAFSGNIRTEYGTSKQTSSNQIFMTWMEKHIISGVEFTGTTEDLTQMLSKGFLDDVKKVDENAMAVSNLFKEYGTHLIVEYYIGGRVRLNFAYTNENNMKESEIKTKAKATYNAVTTEVDASKKESLEEFASVANMRFQSFGGNHITGMSVKEISSQMKDWTKSIAENQTICGIGDFERSLIPIWELLDDTEYKSAQLKIEKEFVEQSKRKSLFLGELDFLDDKNDYISDIIVVDASTESAAKALVPKDYKFVCVNFDGDEILDANKGRKHYIFIAYKTTKSKNGAITDIIVDLGKNRTHEGYTKIEQDLNKNVGGEHVYLYYKNATLDEAINPETKFIREIRGQYNKINSLPAAWSQPSITKDLNSGAGGKYIYLMVRKS